MQYKCLLNYICQTKSTNIIKYPKEILNIFNDPINFTLMQSPIFIKNHPFEIYDKQSLITWFYRSNKEPVTGIELDKRFEFVYILNYYIAMILLEEHEDYLIFHKPDIDLINLCELVDYIIKCKNNKKINPTHLDKNYIFNFNPCNKIIELDIDCYYVGHLEKKI